MKKVHYREKSVIPKFNKVDFLMMKKYFLTGKSLPNEGNSKKVRNKEGSL